MIAAIWVDAAPQTAADPYELGVHDTVQTVNHQAGDPRYNTQAQSAAPKVAPVQTFAGGLKWALSRVWPSAVPGIPAGPPRRNHGVIRGRRNAGTAPQTVERTIMPGTPGSSAQMASRRPLYENYLIGSDPYLAF